MAKAAAPQRIHLLAHANPAGADINRLGFVGPDEYLDYIVQQLPKGWKLSFTREIFDAVEDEQQGGRSDDALRIKDLNQALRDKTVLAIVALNGGAYLSRILPELNFAALRERKAPLWMLGFSEITSLVNLVSAYPCGHALYWLSPNFLVRELNPTEHARAAFADFWRAVPQLVAGRPIESRYLPSGPIEGAVAAGKPASDKIRVIGGCLSVLAALVGGSLLKPVKLDKAWLLIEDVNEAIYRIDRHLAALKIAGWFERLGGIIIGDFHTRERPDQTAAVVELLKFHLPPARKLPVLTTRSLGHTWPMLPLPINRPLSLKIMANRFSLDM